MRHWLMPPGDGGTADLTHIGVLAVAFGLVLGFIFEPVGMILFQAGLFILLATMLGAVGAAVIGGQVPGVSNNLPDGNTGPPEQAPRERLDLDTGSIKDYRRE